MALTVQTLNGVQVFIPQQDLIQMIISNINTQAGQNLQPANISVIDIDEEFDATGNFTGLSIVFELKS